MSRGANFILRDFKPPHCRDLEDFLRAQRGRLSTTDGWSFERSGRNITVTAPSRPALRDWLGRHFSPADADALMQRVQPF